jgi:hypothetical protein
MLRLASTPFGSGSRRLDGHDVGWRLIFGDVLVAREDPGDALEIDPVLMLEYAARPEAVIP